MGNIIHDDKNVDSLGVGISTRDYDIEIRSPNKTMTWSLILLFNTAKLGFDHVRNTFFPETPWDPLKPRRNRIYAFWRASISFVICEICVWAA